MFINVLHAISTTKMPLLSCNASLRSYVDEPRLSRAVTLNMKRPPNFKDLTGQKFGKWVIIKYDRSFKRKTYWLCKCECGVEKGVESNSLIRGLSISCGCYAMEMKTTHGNSHSPEYNVWRNLIQRCINKKHPRYYDWGGRGIKIDDRWIGKGGFSNFIADMGFRPSPKHSIDRYPDKNGNYEPSNCRWATMKDQSRGKRNNVNITYKGETMCFTDWSIKLGIAKGTLWKRLNKRNLSIDKAFEAPINKKMSHSNLR